MRLGRSPRRTAASTHRSPPTPWRASATHGFGEVEPKFAHGGLAGRTKAGGAGCSQDPRAIRLPLRVEKTMSLTTGEKLGSYEILSPLGAGGMGEVYKAKDTRLDRTVAIKVLPSHLSDNARPRKLRR